MILKNHFETAPSRNVNIELQGLSWDIFLMEGAPMQLGLRPGDVFWAGIAGRGVVY